jgi:hypothetical protein
MAKPAIVYLVIVERHRQQDLGVAGVRDDAQPVFVAVAVAACIGLPR